MLHKAVPVAAAVVEFAGGPMAWVTRTYTASRGAGAQCNGKDLHVTATSNVTQSLLVCVPHCCMCCTLSSSRMLAVQYTAQMYITSRQLHGQGC